MPFELAVGGSVLVIAQPVDQNGNNSAIQSGSAVWSVVDTTILTITPDPSNELQATITKLLTGSDAFVLKGNADTTGATQVIITGTDVITDTPTPPVLAAGFNFAFQPA